MTKPKPPPAQTDAEYLDYVIEQYRGLPQEGNYGRLVAWLEELRERREAVASLVGALEVRRRQAARPGEPRVVSIIGLFPALLDRIRGEAWGIADPRRCYPGLEWDRVYDLYSRRPACLNADYEAWADRQVRMVVAPCREPRTNRRHYPLEAALGLVGGDKAMLSSSVALMIAHAIIEEVDGIHITGFSFLRDGPYRFQLGAIQRLIRMAIDRGIEVGGPCVSSWLAEADLPLEPTDAVYALENDGPAGAVATMMGGGLTATGGGTAPDPLDLPELD